MSVTYVDAVNYSLGVQPSTVLAGAYESRATQIAKLFVPTASFAGDTAQTLTDGSFNSNNNSILKSSTAVLADPSNIKSVLSALNPNNYNGHAAQDYASLGNDVDDNNDGTIDDGDGDGTVNPVTAKPLIIKVTRDPFSGEVINYGVFNADGTVPGQAYVAGTPLYTPGQAGDPFDPNQAPRYLVDRMTGQIYLNNGAGIIGVNLDSAAGGEIFRDEDSIESGTNSAAHVVGIVEFKALEGAALSTAQQKASELSNVIQSLATLIRGFKDSDRSIMNVIK